MLPDERFDVVVVGARVAGAATAVQFARRGMSVLVLEKDGRQSRVMSTHTIQDVAGLEDLLGASAIAQTRTPRITGATFWMQDVDLSADHPQHPWLSMRRVVLDELFVQAAEAAGAQVRFGCKVSDLLRSGQRVCGVRYRDEDGTSVQVTSTLVVGADGRSSAVARLVGARRYNVSSNERGAAWCYLRGVPAESRFFSHRFDDMLLLAAPVDHDLVMLGMQPVIDDVTRYREPGKIEQMFRDRARPWRSGGPDWTTRLLDAERVSATQVVLRYPCFLRDGAGPGWALVGDAGYTKDVITGQGISDAMRQAQLLAQEVAIGWPTPTGVDEGAQRYWRRRDRDNSPMYFLSQDMGRSGPIPWLYRGFFAHLADSPRLKQQLQDVLGHRHPVRRFLAPPRVLLATAKYALRPGVDRAALARDLVQNLVAEINRRKLERLPRYERPLAAASEEPVVAVPADPAAATRG